MTLPDPPLTQLRTRLRSAISPGFSDDPIAHAGQVAQVAGVLWDAFEAAGLEPTLVGGSAIEVHAPGIHKSGDVDIVFDRVTGVRETKESVLRSLGFTGRGRHWVLDELFIDTPPGPVAGPTELVRVGDAAFRIVKKEVLVRDRIVGFWQWDETGHGAQAIEMLAAFGDDLDEEWLRSELEREGSLDALAPLQALLSQEKKITEQSLRELLSDLKGSR